MLKNLNESEYQKILKKVPDPLTEEFLVFIKENNQVILDTTCWIIIRNCKYDGDTTHLTMFSKEAAKDTKDLSAESLLEMAQIFSCHRDKLIFLNKKEKRSIPDRLHFHLADQYI